MNKSLLSMLAALLISAASFAQISGSKTIPGDYPSIQAAISALNTSGTGPGGVTFNVNAGYVETFTSAQAGYILTTTGSAAQPVVFQKSGTGANPVIIAPVGTGTMDAIIAIAGCDYVTFNGINLQENPANTTTATQMEWGYALLKGPMADGTQNTTIKNCSISLATANTASTGIYSAPHSIASTTVIVPTASSGANSNLKIFANTINCYNGIVLNGYNDGLSNNFAYYDQSNEIGKDGANIITNIGGGSVIGYGITASYQDNFKVANNTITSTTAGSATAIYGMYLLNANNSNYEVYGNSVSIQYSGPGNSSMYPIWAEMGGVGQYNTVRIYNNTVSNCTFPTFTTGNVRFINIANSGVTTYIYGNTVSNNVIGSTSVTATGNIYYLAMNKNSQVYGPVSFYNNTVTGNSRLQTTPASSITYFLWLAGSATSANVYNNSVTNNIVTSLGNTNGINCSLSLASSKIYDNLVSGISAANGTFFGINFSSSSNNIVTEVYRNTIQNIQGDNAATQIHGIYTSSMGAGNIVTYYNNMISDLRAPAGVQASVPVITGINITGGNLLSLYYNSVYLNASSTGANFGTAALYSVTSMPMLELKNNIFVNTSTPAGTGTTAALRFTNSTITNYAQTSNNNLFYSGTPGVSNVLFFDGTNRDQGLSAFQSRVYPRETLSVTGMPPFINTASGSTNLHLQTGVATPCESGGTPVTNPLVNADYDMNPRYPNAGFPTGAIPPAAPDMGADEFGGTPVDIVAPLIIYTPLAHTNFTTARTLSVTITDYTGVPISGIGLPMLYWKVNSGAYTGVQGTYVSSNTYTFTFGGGVATGDVVSYYVVAQDLATVPNVTARPFTGSIGFTSNPPACATAPTTPDSYTIVAGYTGIFHVGTGKDYPTLTAAAADFNTKVLTGPVTYLLDDNTYPSETYPISFNANAGSSATNLLTIKPNPGASPVFEALVTTGIIDFNGVDYVLLDGSNNGTFTKNLTISNPKTITGGTYAISFKCSGASSNDPATNITIRNCILKNIRLDQSTATNASVRFIGVSGSFENIVIDRNIIHTAFTGIQIWGSSSARAKNIKVTNNVIGSTVSGEAISRYGVDIQYADNTLVENNEIMGPVDGSLNTAQCGVSISNYSTNTKVTRNIIHTFWRPSDDGWGCYGIYFASDASTVTELSNNVIYDIHSYGSAAGVAQSNTYGIFVRNGGNLKIVNNSIYLSGENLSSNLDASSACLGFYQQVMGNIEIRNNILRNSQTKLGGGSIGSGRAHGIMICGNATMFSNIDYNDYFIDGVNGSVAQVFTQQAYIFYPTLASWQAYTGQEAHSLDIDPVLTSATNLLPLSGPLNNKGIYLPEITVDITGATRSNPCDVGAYEFGNDPKVATLTKNTVTYNSAVVTGLANAAGTTLNVYFDLGTTTAYGTPYTATPATVTGLANTAVQVPLTGLLPLTTYHYRVRGISSTGQIVFGVDSIFTTLPAPPTVTTTAATSVTSSGATLNGTVNPNGGTATVTIEYGLTTAYGNTVAATPGSLTGLTASNILTSISGLTPYTTYNYRVVASNISGTTYGNNMTFTTLAVPSTVTTLAATNIIGVNAQLNGSVNANYAPTNVTFDWGLTTAYGNSVIATPVQATGSTPTSVSASISGLTIATVYHYRCVGNGPGGIVYGNDMVFTSDCPTTAMPGPISGLANVCKNTNGVVYSVVPVTGATGYVWTVPSGATIVSGANTNSITVNFSATAANGDITVSATNSCGNSPLRNLAINLYTLPVPAIAGPSSMCLNSSGNVYITQPGMTNYQWTVTGGTITAGSGTNTITVTWNSSGNQSVSVNYANSNGCMAVAPSTYPVTVLPLPVPTIAGNTVACESSVYLDYTTEPGMTNYQWSISPNSGYYSVTGTNLTTVFWTTPGTSWVSVTYTDANGCTALPGNYYVTVNPLPVAPGTINGQTSLCAGTNSVTYTVAPVTGATSYTWAVPSGATIVSGTGSNTIMVNYGATAASGNVSVSAQNACGNGPASTLPVVVNSLPGAAGTITGEQIVCQGTSGVAYSITAVTGATGYNWVLPAGASIVSGANTNNILVDFGLNATSGNISVNAVNACGAGNPSSKALTVNAKPTAPVIALNTNVLSSSAITGNQWYRNGAPIAGATGQYYTVTQDGTYTAVVIINGCSSAVSNSIVIDHTGLHENTENQVSIYPNPTQGAFWITLNISSTSVFELQIFNTAGICVYKNSNLDLQMGQEHYIELNGLAPGVYTLQLHNKDIQYGKKLVITR